MALTSTISAHDRAWPAMFQKEAMRLRPIFAQSLVAIHHVGSTAVPELMAKPEIDWMLRFRDYLRCHPEVREEYQTLKLRLEAENTAGIREYIDGKTSFIEGVLARVD